MVLSACKITGQMGIKADQMCLAIARVLENEKDQYLYFAPYGNDV